MFQTNFQGPLFTAFHSGGSHPLDNWLVQCKEGEMKQVLDDVVKSNVLQIQSLNVNACCITCPVDPKGSLGVRMPYLTLLLKNLGQYFTFEITILDSEKIRRRVRLSNYHSVSKTSTFMVTKPMCMDEGWNRVGLKLAEIVSDAFKTTYVETVRIQVHANCRLRRIYFSSQEYKEDQLPNAYRMYKIAVVREKPKRLPKKIAGPVDKKSTAVVEQTKS
ncbi:cilia- and flagella-associated protein 20-like [Metopolophium dirhodum]|uniref:cilia- and flagella-associated protein 20-like n=1 Tax=Metopolophium dirhodum TaxID=44670 RepID=UPI0029902531|nr:cilia- and flagella-associated protein 20-like [Metopolophium dirhodum]